MCIIELHDIQFTPVTDTSNIIQISSFVPSKLIYNLSHLYICSTFVPSAAHSHEGAILCREVCFLVTRCTTSTRY